MAYWRLFYHFVWATKGREPFITPDIEDVLYRVLYGQGKEFRVPLMKVGGVSDHVHVLVALSPAVSPATFVKRLKGMSSWFLAQKMDIPFRWQAGYGVFSVSERDVPLVIEYIRRQKEHHAAGMLIPQWEQTSSK